MLEALFDPNSIALIGASQSPGKVGHEILHNLVGGGYRGNIVPVNPRCKEILGRRCFSDLREYGMPVDLCVIATPRNAVYPAVESALKNGVKTIIVITAGFREASSEGKDLEESVAQLCRANGVRLLGPNCLGAVNTRNRLNASFSGGMPAAGSISVLSQSGALCTAILDWADSMRIGLNKLVSLGNKADLNEIDLLHAYAADPTTEVIAGYLESVESGGEFLRAAEAASRKKPTILLKAGGSEAGRRAAASHTGSLAGADAAYEAAFRRSGVVRAGSFQELLDFAMAFAMQPAPKGDRTAIITNAGGPGIMTADALERAGLTVATISESVATALRKKLPAAASVGNPVDVLGDADPNRYVEAAIAAQEDPAVDAIIVLLTPQAMTLPEETARAVAGCVRGDKTVLAAFMGGKSVLPGRDAMTEAGLPNFDAPERAVAALRAMRDYEIWRGRPPRAIVRFPVNRRRVERVVNRRLKSGEVHVGETDAKLILDAYDFRTPEGGLARSAGEAAELADRIGYPVVAKIASPDLVHKSDVGGVKLNLADREAVRDAFDLMTLRLNQKAPEARLDGIRIEKMAGKGREVILGLNRDPRFGPMLMFGVGGIYVEVLKDVAFHLAPITEEEAMQMMKATRSYALLAGARGQAGVDLRAVARCLQRISQLGVDFPQIAELDINPLIVPTDGDDPVVADARIALREANLP